MKDKQNYIIVLQNINIKKVNSKYEIVNKSNDFTVDDPEITTKLSNLNIIDIFTSCIRISIRIYLLCM